MALKTILNKSNIINFLGLSDAFGCDFTQFDIQNIELYEFHNNLGIDFYNELIASLTPESVIDEWQPNIAYPINTKVMFCGKCYVTIESSVSVEPTNVLYWKLCSDKFSNACATVYNDLYNNFLGQYLALCVFRSKLSFIYTNLAPEGALKFNGNHWKADEKSEKNLSNAINLQIKIVLENMNYWVVQWRKDNPNSQCLTNYGKSNNDESECGCGTETTQKRTGYGWRVG